MSNEREIPSHRADVRYVLRVPDGTTELPEGTVVSNEDLATHLVSHWQKGSVLVLPATRDERGDYLWDFKQYPIEADEPITLEGHP